MDVTETYPERAETARRAARAGGERALEQFRSGIAVDAKGEDGLVTDPAAVVTEADRAAQRAVVAVLEEAFPADAIVGEEDEELKEVPAEGWAWIIDPIDGTYNYVRGLQHWTTSVALVRDEEPIVAVNEHPAQRDTYVATSEGTTLNGTEVGVSERPTLESATVAPVVIPAYGQRGDYAEAVRRLVEEFGNVRRYGSAQATLSLVAAGAIEGTVTNTNPNPWDTVVGAHLVERAGGVVTDVHGDDWRHDSHGIVASNGQGEIHDRLVDVAGTMLGDR